MTQRVTWVFLLGCAVIASLEASTAWSVLARTLWANPSFAGELELAGDLVPRKPEPASIPDRSLPRRPESAPASEPSSRSADPPHFAALSPSSREDPAAGVALSAARPIPASPTLERAARTNSRDAPFEPAATR